MNTLNYPRKLNSDMILDGLSGRFLQFTFVMEAFFIALELKNSFKPCLGHRHCSQPQLKAREVSDARAIRLRLS